MVKKGEKAKNGYRLNELGVYIYGRRSVTVDGFAPIRDYNSERVVFGTGKRREFLIISGKNLTVRIAGENVTEIKGYIRFVTYSEELSDV